MTKCQSLVLKTHSWRSPHLVSQIKTIFQKPTFARSYFCSPNIPKLQCSARSCSWPLKTTKVLKESRTTPVLYPCIRYCRIHFLIFRIWHKKSIIWVIGVVKQSDSVGSFACRSVKDPPFSFLLLTLPLLRFGFSFHSARFDIPATSVVTNWAESQSYGYSIDFSSRHAVIGKVLNLCRFVLLECYETVRHY